MICACMSPTLDESLVQHSIGFVSVYFVFFQAEDGIRDLVRSRGLGDVYKRQRHDRAGGVLDLRPGDRRLAALARNTGADRGRQRLSLIHI